jgi:hypothetical protein
VSLENERWPLRMRWDAPLIETDEEPSEREGREIISWLNELRAKGGNPPLIDDWEHRPEEQFYVRARALGMARIPRRDP